MRNSELFERINKETSKRDISNWKPEILDPNNQKEVDRIAEIISDNQPVITDDLFDQVKELVKCMYPKERLSGKAQEEKAKLHLGEIDQNYYGVWVYYSWSNKLVHLLAETEFVQVRTNRNHYKISPAEQAALATKKVGLIGLSVGQSVAVTMAMERGFGELRLADFDTLELTNLNRIRTGVHNLGLSKVISVAREIMEIDPFLNLRCFTDGITEENLESFFLDNGKLDLLIDECDGLEIKVLCRHMARDLEVPVVMEASDRGMVDVERFDLQPDRPLLHGLIDDLNPEKLKTFVTNEEKIPYMLDIVGLETISTRAKASMLEIGETITTWPQLASAVTLGGGITADVVRRIFLNQFKDSGRYYMDVEAIIGDAKMTETTKAQSQKPADIQISDIVATSSEKSVSLSSSEISNIVQAACHAPSGGNLQPWKWVHSNGVLSLYHLTHLTSSFLDHNNIASYLALGASIENAVLKAGNLGYQALVSNFPDPNSPELIAQMSFETSENIKANSKILGENIMNRTTNRNIESGENISDAHKTFLRELALENDSELLIIDDTETKNALANLIAFAEKFRILHPTGHQNFIEEMRWTPEEVERTKDGIDIATCDLTVGELAGFKLATNRDVVDKLIEWNGGTAFENLSKKSTGSAAALGIITRPNQSREDFIKAGRDMERVWVGANTMGIGFQPQSPLSLIFQRLESGADLSATQIDQLAEAHKLFNAIIAPLTDRTPIFIFRLFNAKRPVVKSLRRAMAEHFQSDI